MNEEAEFDHPPETAEQQPCTSAFTWWEAPSEPQRGPLPTGIKPSRALEDIHARERRRRNT
jgi:hypothetical protein